MRETYPSIMVLAERRSSRGAVECGTCNPKVVGASTVLSKVPSYACSKNCGPQQGRVRQLTLRASLESVGGSDHYRVASSLYKCEVPPVRIPRPRVTGDKVTVQQPVI